MLSQYQRGVFLRGSSSPTLRPRGGYGENSLGLADMGGNVWEWTASAIDPDRNVIKGGSFLCAANYCARYRAAARQFQERSLGTDHVGIRLIDTARPPPPDEKPHEG
jgi:formylglycine-generating enzyme required for sulfatase activity